MENQKPNPSPSQSLPWYDDRVEAIRKDDATPVADTVEEPAQYTEEKEGGMELLFDFDDRQRITNVRFKGLDGTERVSSMSQALGLMKISSPVTTFCDGIYCLAYENVTPEEFQRMLNTVILLDSMWHYPDGAEGTPPQHEMNILMLLANAIELVSKLYAELQDRSGEA